MNIQRAAGFLVEIDGEPKSVYEDLISAKNAAISLSNGSSRLKITSIGPGIVPSSAWCWDYESNEWVFTENAVFAEMNSG